jgi:hypothetical protein
VTEWLITAGQMAFSFLLNIATHAEMPAFHSAPRGLSIWQEAIGWLAASGTILLLTGFGVLATARAFLRSRSR